MGSVVDLRIEPLDAGIPMLHIEFEVMAVE